MLWFKACCFGNTNTVFRGMILFAQELNVVSDAVREPINVLTMQPIRKAQSVTSKMFSRPLLFLVTTFSRLLLNKGIVFGCQMYNILITYFMFVWNKVQNLFSPHLALKIPVCVDSKFYLSLSVVSIFNIKIYITTTDIPLQDNNSIVHRVFLYYLVHCPFLKLI